MIKQFLVTIGVLSLLGAGAARVKADALYTITGFKWISSGTCSATFSVTPLPSTASVSDTRVDGKETKPLRVNLTAGGTPSGDLSPVENKAGGWYVTTHAFNGTSFKSGTWTITITNPKLVHPTATAFSGVHKISPAPRASSSACREYDGTTVKFEYR